MTERIAPASKLLNKTALSLRLINLQKKCVPCMGFQKRLGDLCGGGVDSTDQK